MTRRLYVSAAALAIAASITAKPTPAAEYTIRQARPAPKPIRYTDTLPRLEEPWRTRNRHRNRKPSR